MNGPEIGRHRDGLVDGAKSHERNEDMRAYECLVYRTSLYVRDERGEAWHGCLKEPKCCHPKTQQTAGPFLTPASRKTEPLAPLPHRLTRTQAVP